MPMTSHYPPSAEIEIKAPLQRVWDVLLDGEGYAGWNRFIPEVDGALEKLNTPIHMRVELGGRNTRAVMCSVIVTPPQAGEALWVHAHASWLAKTGLVRSRRHHALKAIDEATTGYRTWEPFSGLLKRFVPLADIDAGFKTQAADLKAVCEQSA